ncbi:MAG: hypothetical protein C3F02_01775 [Parcubacteria group bacterium]|nr:MAG: hypothetical protein C3F02_01775 [Parcubacteria group bacterium]
MYLYIYDSFLNDKKYVNLLAKIEQRVTDLSIKGRTAKLSILKNMKELITDAVKDGVKTVVAVGNGQTFAKVINIVADLDVTLGLIPVDDNNLIARALGVPSKVAACDVLASRIIKKIDLGKINNHYFFKSAEIVNGAVTIDFSDFQVQPTTEKSRITLHNFSDHDLSPGSNPSDGFLEVVITPYRQTVLGKKRITGTVLPFNKVMINSDQEEEVSILTDEQIIMKTPADIVAVPGRLKVIVGGERDFD